MRRLISVAFLTIAAAHSAMAALKPGDAAPAFTATASQNGKEFNYSLRSALEKGPVVVYFYPAAFTRGCSIQARAFATNMDKFAAAGATVLGVSLDDIATLNQFSADPEFCAGKVPVASDANGSIAKSFDVKITEASGVKDSRGESVTHGFAERSTFVISRDGKVASVIGGVAPAENVQQALQAVQQLAGGPTAAQK